MPSRANVRLGSLAGATLTLALACRSAVGADDLGYRDPPPAIAAVLEAPALPKAFVSPARDVVLLARPVRFPPASAVGNPPLELGGLRIDAATNALRGASTFDTFALVRIANGSKTAVELPRGERAGAPVWNPDGTRFAFTSQTAAGTEPCIASVADGSVRCYGTIHLNALFGDALAWIPGGDELLLHTTGDAPRRQATAVSPGPLIRESIGTRFAPRGAGEIATDAVAASEFARYASGSYVAFDAGSEHVTTLVSAGIYAGASVSPDGRFIAFERYGAPASGVIAWSHEAHRTIAIDRAGHVVAMLDDVPSDGVTDPSAPPRGPRDVAWEPNAPATLVWLSSDAERDAIYALTIGSHDQPRVVLDTSGRVGSISFLRGTSLAVVRDYERETNTLRTFAFAVDGARGSRAEAVGSFVVGDTFDDPGEALAPPDARGERVVERESGAIFLAGEGYTTTGLRPFVDRIDLATHTRRRLFQSATDPLETVVAMLDARGNSFLVQRQSPSLPPDLFVRRLDTHELRQLTHFADPAPALRTLERRVVSYKRADGVGCSFTLYLPPGTRPGARLPTLLWAYPFEFDDRAAASQNANFVQTFDEPESAAAHLAALAGYAVLDDVAMPIVGDRKTASDTLVDQLAMDARAAIDEAVDIGVTDRSRVAVGGHSYGAFMAATLLAHTHLFRAGIARSGAYNRTLTPFGFQNESRTYWQASETYARLSPFAYADHIDAPLLLIHGALDDNPATPALQSERMYDAIRGNGGTARLVILPDEAHAYASLEAVKTTAAEEIDWLDRYVKSGH